jgi:hypothetical protein
VLRTPGPRISGGQRWIGDVRHWQHGDRPVGNYLYAAIRDTGGSHAERKRLTAIILKRASDAARQTLEAMMKTDEWEDDFIESYVKIGVEQGIEKGDQQGAARTKAQDVLKVIDARKLKPTKEQRAMVTADAGLDKLDLWFDRALTAATVADIFKDDEV